MNAKLLDLVKIAVACEPSSDLHDGSPSTDVVNLENYDKANLLLITKSTTGTATVTIEACSDVAGTGATAIAFKKRKMGPMTTDSLGAATDVTAAGFTTDAGSTNVYALEVDSVNCPSGKPFVRATLTETVDAATIGAAFWLMETSRYCGPLPTAIS